MDRRRTHESALPLPDLLEKLGVLAEVTMQALALGLVRARSVRPDQASRLSTDDWAEIERLANTLEAENPDKTAVELLSVVMMRQQQALRQILIREMLVADEGGVR